MRLAIDSEFQGLLPRLSPTEAKNLRESIEADGCESPLRAWRGTLVDGHHRYEVCITTADGKKRRKPLPFTVTEVEGLADRAAVLAWIIATQESRRNLQIGQRCALALRLKAALAKIGKERMSEGGAAKARSVKTDKPSHDTREEIAKLAGVSTGTVAQFEVVVKAEAEGLVPEGTVAKVEANEETVNAAYKKAKAAERAAKKAEMAEELRQQPLPLVSGTFDVLVIDPPWKYESRANDPTHRGRCPYPDMSIDEIKALDVPSRLNENAIVWLWTTNAFMREAYEIADAWGLRVRTILTWGKDRMGTGDWLRGQTEHCLLCTMGSPIVMLTNQTTLLRGPLREHSRKPDEFYALVDALCPGTKLEMFAREARKGWLLWGAETEKFK